MPLAPDSPEVARIDSALAEWRQGDLALEEQWFVHAADGSLPLTAGSDQAEDGLQALTTEVAGLVMVTQTCDVVRGCLERPFVEVSPLVKAPDTDFRVIARGRRPSYAVVPAVAARLLVADLDRVMTVEKSVVASWKRTPGCATDQARRDFAKALARKRARVAFPDDFTELVAKLMDRLQDKHDKDSEEGRALRALREVRVHAAPSWDAPKVESPSGSSRMMRKSVSKGSPGTIIWSAGRSCSPPRATSRRSTPPFARSATSRRASTSRATSSTSITSRRGQANHPNPAKNPAVLARP